VDKETRQKRGQWRLRFLSCFKPCFLVCLNISSRLMPVISDRVFNCAYVGLTSPLFNCLTLKPKLIEYPSFLPSHESPPSLTEARLINSSLKRGSRSNLRAGFLSIITSTLPMSSRAISSAYSILDSLSPAVLPDKASSSTSELCCGSLPRRRLPV